MQPLPASPGSEEASTGLSPLIVTRKPVFEPLAEGFSPEVMGSKTQGCPCWAWPMAEVVQGHYSSFREWHPGQRHAAGSSLCGKHFKNRFKLLIDKGVLRFPFLPGSFCCFEFYLEFVHFFKIVTCVGQCHLTFHSEQLRIDQCPLIPGTLVIWCIG